jgi:hypothetical protein
VTDVISEEVAAGTVAADPVDEQLVRQLTDRGFAWARRLRPPCLGPRSLAGFHQVTAIPAQRPNPRGPKAQRRPPGCLALLVLGANSKSYPAGRSVALAAIRAEANCDPRRRVFPSRVDHWRVRG